MTYPHPFTTAGKETERIPVHISFRIIQLFSEGLYQSPNKAIEELVVNSFDADARNVHVVLTPDRTREDAFIAVIDNGTGMDAAGLRQHWLIGDSKKRAPGTQPKRKQIGKFGIGKLATFVLANRLTHVSKKDGRFYAITMDYSAIPSAIPVGRGGELQPSDPEKVELPLRELTEDEAKAALTGVTAALGRKAPKLFGPNGPASWTAAIMTDFKPLAREIQKGRLEWVLRTAMPLQDDFKIVLDGQELKPAVAASKHLVKRWVIGKDIAKVDSPKGFEATEDAAEPDPELRFGLTHPALGTVSGYAELYEDLLTEGKAAELSRSHGFFVYVRKRLVNLDDALFGLPALRHGTFARFRAALHIDKLDDELRSSRETVRDGPLTTLARDILGAIFNIVRLYHEQHESEKTPGELAARKISGSPRSLTGRPILALVRAALEGKASPRLLEIPPIASKSEQQDFLAQLEARAESDDKLVTAMQLDERGSQLAMATLDVATGVLRINALHPFVAANRDDYERHRETFGLLSMADVLTEAYLHQEGVDPAIVAEVLSKRDELLREFAKSLPQTASMRAQALEDASTDKTKLERALVECFHGMGFQATPIGGSGRADGKAEAFLSGQKSGATAFSISLEAKSTQKSNATVSAKDIAVSAVARHRDDLDCDHALVVAPEFPTSKGDEAAVIAEVRKDREAGVRRAEAEGGRPRTITLVRVHDLARLVRLVSLKCVGLDRLHSFFQECATPKESKDWIDKLEGEAQQQAPVREVLDTIWEEQQREPNVQVEFTALRILLRDKRNLSLTNEQLSTICQSLASLAPNVISVRSTRYVELRTRPDLILAAVAEAVKQAPEPEQAQSSFQALGTPAAER